MGQEYGLGVEGLGFGLGPRYTTGLPPLTATVSRLGELQLLGHLEQARVNFNQLTPKQLQDLLVLVPAEQDYSHDTPTVNILIAHKQKHDLTAICTNSLYRHPSLGVTLPTPSEVERMAPDQIHAVLAALTERVGQLMRDVGYGPTTSAPALVRSPNHLANLLGQVLFSDLLKYDAGTLFANKQRVLDLLLSGGRWVEQGYAALADYARRASIGTLPSLVSVADSASLAQEMNRAMSAVASATTPEELQRGVVEYIRRCAGAFAIRQRLADAICQQTKEFIDNFTPYISQALFPMMPALDQIFAGPIPGQEMEWTYRLDRALEAVRPLIAVVRGVQDFLEPYISGEITRQTEDMTRGDLAERIRSEFRVQFPEVGVSDEAMSHLVLSVYLKSGARGLDMQSLEMSRSHRVAEKEEDAAHEVERVQSAHLAAFTEALAHSLRIDFANLNVTDAEVAWLANYTFRTPTAPLPVDWRSRVRL